MIRMRKLKDHKGKKINVCVVTATRAEYGLLKPVIREIKNNEAFDLDLVVTGAHLSPEFGYTYREIEKDEFYINEKIEMVLSSDTSVGIAKSMGVAIMGFAEYFKNKKPDILLILGDRYEILAVATCALIYKIPIAHIHGGELTEGAIDDAIRHSITKMSHIHFAATEQYAKRIIQLGENPQNVFCVGALGVENIKKLTLLTKEEIEKELDYKIGKRLMLVTFHPVTINKESSVEELEILLEVLKEYKEFNVIFTRANADENGRMINSIIAEFVNQYENRMALFDSLGQLKYLSCLKYSEVVIGNSSSGIIEAPSLNVPTVNIGERQKGRMMAASIINCECNKVKIKKAIDKAISLEFKEKIRNIVNPYEGNNTSKKIIYILKEKVMNGVNLNKKFYDVEI